MFAVADLIGTTRDEPIGRHRDSLACDSTPDYNEREGEWPTALSSRLSIIRKTDILRCNEITWTLGRKPVFRSLENTRVSMYSVELRALIVSPDTGTAAILVRLFRDLCVRAHVCADQTSAPGCLFGAKFKAVVLDWDCIAEDMPFVRNLREGRANRNAVVLAIATNSSAK